MAKGGGGLRRALIIFPGMNEEGINKAFEERPGGRRGVRVVTKEVTGDQLSQLGDEARAAMERHIKDVQAYERRRAKEINKQRARKGLPPLGMPTTNARTNARRDNPRDQRTTQTSSGDRTPRPETTAGTAGPGSAGTTARPVGPTQSSVAERARAAGQRRPGPFR